MVCGYFLTHQIKIKDFKCSELDLNHRFAQIFTDVCVYFKILRPICHPGRDLNIVLAKSMERLTSEFLRKSFYFLFLSHADFADNADFTDDSLE